mmetsp:Transcript_13363/g.43548  ORF Transcript_13363/g.43548 Transcript_13363/m.43548 type:complete len:214 (+) Transcript_13363:136-777(+)
MFLCLATTTLTALTAVKPRGTVAPGAVVVAPTQEYNHFLRKATVFVLDDGDDGTIGVNLGSPTMLTIGEAAANVVTGDLGDNKLWMGGEHGGTGAVMLHAVPGLAGSKKIGDSDIFVGGIAQARQLVDDGQKRPADFKFFFNVAKWPKGLLQDMVDEGRWLAFDNVPTSVVLDQDPDLDVPGLWSSFRKLNARLRKQEKEQITDDDERHEEEV